MMWLWFVAAFVAYFIKGLCGFANTLIFTTILSFHQNNVNISPVDLIIGYPANMILTWKNRKALDAHIYIPLSLFVIIGSIPGAFLLKNVNTTLIKVFFGMVVIILGLELFLQVGYLKKKTSQFGLMIIGILSGFLCGLFGIGALLAAYVSRVTEHQDAFKANMSVVFIVDNTLRIILYSYLHILTFTTLKFSLLLMPVVLLGLYVGIKCSDFFSEKHVYKITAILLILSGISIMIKNL